MYKRKKESDYSMLQSPAVCGLEMAWVSASEVLLLLFYAGTIIIHIYAGHCVKISNIWF